MKQTQHPDRKMLFWKDIYLPNSHINIPKLSKELAYETIIHTPVLKDMIVRCQHITVNQPNLMRVTDPAIVIGDIHGQFYDLLNILSHTEMLKPDLKPSTKLVFLGDYVDRGINSIEVMIILMALKIEYSQNIILLRGNHQSRIMTEQYNFREECCMKYSQDIYESILELFNTLPIACIINNQYFCVHGGVTDKMIDIEKINGINRNREIPLMGEPFCDFIWSDPTDRDNGKMKSKVRFNDSRDCSIIYGVELVNDFLKVNNLTTVIRGHEVFIEGYKTHQWNGIKSPPPVITIFSAPNYCGTCGNKGAVLKISNNCIKIKQFKEQEPQKYRFLVKFDVFSWTLPEILTNVQEIVLEIMDVMIETHIPQLQKETTDKRISALVKYAYDRKIIEHPKAIESGLRVKQRSPEEERNYLFNRSQDYYASYQKVPKHQ